MSDEQPEKRTRKPITVTSRADADATRKAVMARRLGGNVFGHAKNEIPMKEPHKWYTRWDNELVNPQQHYEMVHELGYLPVTRDDIVDGTNLQTTPDGFVCRGAGNALEILYKMPIEDRKQLEAAQTEHNNRIIGKGSASGTKNAITNAASAQLGDEAASFLHSMPGSVVDTITDGEVQ